MGAGKADIMDTPRIPGLSGERTDRIGDPMNLTQGRSTFYDPSGWFTKSRIRKTPRNRKVFTPAIAKDVSGEVAAAQDAVRRRNQALAAGSSSAAALSGTSTYKPLLGG